MEVAAVRTGTILRFDDVRGYGFIVPDGGGQDVFVHANELLDDKNVFVPGASVEFEVAESDRGLKAFAVRIIGNKTSRSATGSVVRPAISTSGAADDDGLCDVLSKAEFLHELTEILLESAPALTGVQIVQLRRQLLKTAQEHGWAED
jgi:cold shock CspA family protein